MLSLSLRTLTFPLAVVAFACTDTVPATNPPSAATPTSPPSTGTLSPATTAPATVIPSPTTTATATPAATPGVAHIGSCSELFDVGDGRIALAIGDSQSKGIATVNADGSGLVEIIDRGQSDNGGTEAPRWITGDRILFHSNRLGGSDDFHIFAVDATGGDLDQLTELPDIQYTPALSPDGSTLAYGKAVATPEGPNPFRDAGLFLSNNDGSNERQLTTAPDGGYDERPDFAPDGQLIAFTRQSGDGNAIYVVKPDGTGLKQLTDISLDAWRPRWSPEGTLIVFNSNAERFDVESANVWVMSPDGSGLRQLTFATGSDQAWAPEWSPDGGHIVFIHGADLEIMAVEGTTHCTLVADRPGNFPSDPDWGPAALVGEWGREQRCDDIVDRLTAAGMNDWVDDYAADYTASRDPADVDRNQPCASATPRFHSHFFSADGRFGSRDETGAQVDDGTYRLLDERTFVIGNYFGSNTLHEVTFHFDIDGDEIRFEPVIPECRPDCFEAVWSVTVAHEGLPWTRVLAD